MLEPAFLSAARQLIAARSVTEEGNLPAVEVLDRLFVAAGFATQRLASPDTPERDANLLVGPIGGAQASGDPLLLVTHLDTVDPGPRDRWRTDPFECTVIGDKAHGLGVADVKLDALCKLWALARLKDVRLNRPVWFLGTYGEEAGLRGARAFLEKAPFHPMAALCGEPCGLKLFSAHKGYGMVRVRLALRDRPEIQGSWSDLRFEGKAAHSSTPHLGINAIERALTALLDRNEPIASLQGGASANTIPADCTARLSDGVGTPGKAVDLRPILSRAKAARDAWMHAVAALSPQTDARFEPSGAVANLTKIRGENGAIELTLDARLLPAQDVEELHARFAADVRVQSDQTADVSIEILRRAGGMSLADDHPLVQACSQVLARLGLDAAPRAKATSTEGGAFVRAGVPAVVYGPTPSTGNAHTANEYANLDEVERAIDVYEALVVALCGKVE